jgi:hypothetical protein
VIWTVGNMLIIARERVGIDRYDRCLPRYRPRENPLFSGTFLTLLAPAVDAVDTFALALPRFRSPLGS